MSAIILVHLITYYVEKPYDHFPVMWCLYQRQSHMSFRAWAMTIIPQLFIQCPLFLLQGLQLWLVKQQMAYALQVDTEEDKVRRVNDFTLLYHFLSLLSSALVFWAMIMAFFIHYPLLLSIGISLSFLILCFLPALFCRFLLVLIFLLPGALGMPHIYYTLLVLIVIIWVMQFNVPDDIISSILFIIHCLEGALYVQLLLQFQ